MKKCFEITSGKVFLFSFICGFFLTAGLFVWVITWYIPRLDTEGWAKEVLRCKLDIAARTPSPKIIVLGGSNAFFGMDSATLEKKCGFPVVNLAFHATFPVSCYKDLLKDVLKKDDMVIVPLEFEQYTQEAEINDVGLLACLGWGKEFFPSQNLFKLAVFYAFPVVCNTSFIRRIPKKTSKFLKKKFPETSREKTLASFHQAVGRRDAKRPEQGKIYSFTNLNRYGDLVRTGKRSEKIKFPKLAATVPSPFFLREFRQLRRAVHGKNAGIALVWPVIFAGNDLAKIRELKQNCARNGIPIHGEPEKNIFPKEDFFDTYYHLQSSAAKKRAELLADCLLEHGLLPGKKQIPR